jgi:hypothetical protein
VRLQTVVLSKFGILKSVAQTLEKAKGLKYQHLLPDWHRRHDELKVRLVNPIYHHGIYAKDIFMEGARLAAHLYKVQWSVDVDSYATVAIEGAGSDIDHELSSHQVTVHMSLLWPCSTGSCSAWALLSFRVVVLVFCTVAG